MNAKNKLIFLSECGCDPTGSSSGICNNLGGQCICKTNVDGRRCDRCKLGFFGFGPDGCKRNFLTF